MLVVDYRDLHELAGQDLGYSRWMLVDQKRIDGFANVTEDHQWIHVDPVRAARERGHTIAHGYLTLSLIPTLGQDLLQVVGISQALNYGSNRLRFIAPVPVDSYIRVHQTIMSVEEKAGGVQVVSAFAVACKGAEKPACVSEQVVLYLP